jgi:acid phosphatase
LSEPEQVDGTWSSDKTSRRECLRLDHDIIMLFGDQLGDFTEAEDSPSGESGRDIAVEYAEYWGKTWFMLPNPTYGDWRPRDSAEKRSLIRGID